jgi:4-hydroxy-3-methylbut-2-enyl diphosphate reductase
VTGSLAPGLVILAPLRLEARAVRGGAPGATVVRTGAGPARAAATARRLAGPMVPTPDSATAGSDTAGSDTAGSDTAGSDTAGSDTAEFATAGFATAVAGVAGALVAGLHPGDLVVADRVLRPDGTVVRLLPSAPILAGVLRRRGLPVSVGPVVSTDRLVRGAPARAALAATGALAVDLESADLVDAAWAGPVAVVRAMVDTPGRELVSPATLTGGLAALRSLRAAGPALEDWARATGRRRLVLAEPRSFCAGVERAIETVERAIDRFGPPIYVRRQIVHNRHVVERLESDGARFVDELEQVPEGATVVYSAHGVGRRVRAEAADRDLRVIDATCPLVAKVHSEVRRFADRGYQVVLVGHAGHDEVEGTLDETDGMLLVGRADEVGTLKVSDPGRVAYTTQTTLSPDDVDDVVGALRQRWPTIVGPTATDICYATQNRQAAVAAVAAECDLVVVVGSTNSSNSIRLVEVAARAGTRARLIDDASDLDPSWLVGATSVGVTAGASAPEAVVALVVDALAGLGPAEIVTRNVTTESVSFSLPLEVR